jgi:hypothetical protein
VPEFPPGAAVLNTESWLLKKILKKSWFLKKNPAGKNPEKFQEIYQKFLRFFKKFSTGKFPISHLQSEAPGSHNSIRRTPTDSSRSSSLSGFIIRKSLRVLSQFVPSGLIVRRTLRVLLVVHPFGVHDPKTALPFILGCCNTTLEDFPCPIACISPDFFLRREKVRSGAYTGPEKTLLYRFLRIPRIFSEPKFSGLIKISLYGPLLAKRARFAISPFFLPVTLREGFFLRREVLSGMERGVGKPVPVFSTDLESGPLDKIFSGKNPGPGKIF